MIDSERLKNSFFESCETFVPNVGIGTTSPSAKLHVMEEIRIGGSTSGYVGLKAPAVAGSGVLTLPATTGTAGYTLVTDGSGVLSWAATGAASVFPIALGSAATPSMNFSGDTNTGIYSPGADMVAIATSGVEALRVNSSGYIGIGTTSPTARLDIAGDGTASTRLFRTTGSSQYLELHPGDSTNTQLYITANSREGNKKPLTLSSVHDGTGTPAGALGFNFRIGSSAAPTTVMSINESGMVGIGTTSPAARFNVVGTTRIDGSAGVMSPTTFSNFPTDHTFTNGENTIGTMGIFGGATTTGTILTIGSEQAASSAWSQFKVIADTNGTPVTQFLVRGDGNVGIGTTNPSALLTVNNGTTVGTYTTGGWLHTSDGRLKKDIRTIDSALEKILQLRGVEFSFIKDEEHKTQLGFIAQEAEKVFPEVVQTDKEGYKSMVYANLTAPIVEAIKSLSQEIKTLFNKSDDQVRELASLKNKTEDLEKENAKLKAYICQKDPSATLCQ